MGSELALLLEPVSSGTSWSPEGWKEVTQGQPPPLPLPLSHTHRPEKGDKDIDFNLLIGSF